MLPILPFVSERWTVHELSSKLGIPVAAVRRKVALWQSHGVLREDGPDTLVLVDKASGASGGHQQHLVLDHHDDEDMAESAMASAADQKEEELQVGGGGGCTTPGHSGYKSVPGHDS